MTYTDKEGIIAMAALASTLIGKDIANAEELIRKVPGGMRDLGCMRKQSQKLLYGMLHHMDATADEYRRIAGIASRMKIWTGIKREPGHPPLNQGKDFGVYLNWDDMGVIVDVCRSHCMLCSKSEKEIKACKLRSILNSLPQLNSCEGSNGICEWQHTVFETEDN